MSVSASEGVWEEEEDAMGEVEMVGVPIEKGGEGREAGGEGGEGRREVDVWRREVASVFSCLGGLTLGLL